MLLFIVCFCLGFIGFLAIRDRMKYARPPKKTAVKLLKKIDKLLVLKQWEKAEKKLHFLYENGHLEEYVWFGLAKVYRETGRLEKALRWVRFGRRKIPNDLYLLLEEGKILAGLKLWEEAFQALQIALPLLRYEEDYYILGSSLYHLGRFDEAWLVLSPLLEESEDPNLLSLAADSLFQLEEYTEAIKCYHHAIQKGSNSPTLLAKLAAAYQKIGSLQQAEMIYSQILSNDENDTIALLGLGSCMQERRYFHKALAIYQSGKAWKQGNLALLRQAAICALQTHQYAFAQKCFNEMLKKSDPTAEMLSYLGFSLECQGKWEEAEENYLKMISLFQTDPRGFRALAWLFGVGHTRQIKPDKGLQYAYIALELKPDPLGWEILSACEARVGNFEHALQIVEYLYQTTQDKKEKARLQLAIRQLRSHIPLSDQYVQRRLVA